MEVLKGSLINDLFELEEHILKCYQQLKEATNENKEEILANLKICLEVEKKKIQKLDVKDIKEQIQKKYGTFDDLNVFDEILNSSLSKKSQQIYGGDPLQEKLIVNRIFNQLEIFESMDPFYKEEKGALYFDNCYHFEYFEDYMAIYLKECDDRYFYFREYQEYAENKKKIMAFRDDARKQLKLQSKADIYLKYLCLLRTTSLGESIIYDLMFINPLVEKKMIECDVDCSKIMNNLYYYDNEGNNQQLLRMLEQRKAITYIYELLYFICKNNDYDIGIENGVFASKIGSSKKKYNKIISQLFFIRACGTSITNDYFKTIIVNVIEQLDTIKKHDIINLIGYYCQYPEYDKVLFKKKNR